MKREVGGGILTVCPIHPVEAQRSHFCFRCDEAYGLSVGERPRLAQPEPEVEGDDEDDFEVEP